MTPNAPIADPLPAQAAPSASRWRRKPGETVRLDGAQPAHIFAALSDHPERAPLQSGGSA